MFKFGSLVLLGAAACMAADPLCPAIEGTWKQTEARVDPPATLKLEPVQAGGWKVSSTGSEPFTAKPDGQDHPAGLLGTTAAWKKLDARTIEDTRKMNGTPAGTRLMKVSDDGKTMTLDVTSATGVKVFNVYERVAGEGTAEDPFGGEWRHRSMRTAAPGLTYKCVDGKPVAFGVDGKPGEEIGSEEKTYPHPNQQSTVIFKRTGPRSWEMAIKAKAGEITTNSFTLSDDGSTLTWVNALPTKRTITSTYKK